MRTMLRMTESKSVSGSAEEPMADDVPGKTKFPTAIQNRALSLELSESNGRHQLRGRNDSRCEWAYQSNRMSRDDHLDCGRYGFGAASR